MSSKLGSKVKLLVGITAFLSALAAVLTALLGSGGLSGLINIFSPVANSPQAGSPSPSGKGTVDTDIKGDGNVVGDGNQVTTVNKGDCNNIVASGSEVTVICSPASTPFDKISSLGGVASEIQLQATVAGLQRGSNKFTLWLTNDTQDQSVKIFTHNLSISDNSGNTYELDGLAMHGTGLSKTISPEGRIKVSYILSSPISQDATSVTFTLDGVWAQPRGSQFGSPLPQIQWATNL